MANTEKKMTKRERYEDMLAKYPFTEDEVKFIKHELELLDRKNASGEGKMTKTQTANVAYKAEILSAMSPKTAYTVSDMLKSFACCVELSQNKVNALVKQLKDEGKVVRTEEKGRAYFTKVEVEGV